MAASTISPGGALPTALKSSARAATPICHSRLTLVRTILSVMLTMIPTTAALKPPSSVSTFGVVPKRTYAHARASTEMNPGSTNPTYPATAPRQPAKRKPMYASALAEAPPGSICETVTVLANSRSVSQRFFSTTSAWMFASTLSPPPKPITPRKRPARSRSPRFGRSRAAGGLTAIGGLATWPSILRQYRRVRL